MVLPGATHVLLWDCFGLPCGCAQAAPERTKRVPCQHENTCARSMRECSQLSPHQGRRRIQDPSYGKPEKPEPLDGRWREKFERLSGQKFFLKNISPRHLGIRHTRREHRLLPPELCSAPHTVPFSETHENDSVVVLTLNGLCLHPFAPHRPISRVHASAVSVCSPSTPKCGSWISVSLPGPPGGANGRLRYFATRARQTHVLPH